MNITVSVVMTMFWLSLWLFELYLSTHVSVFGNMCEYFMKVDHMGYDL